MLFFGSYKIYQTIINFEKGAKNKIIEIQDKAGVERQANVIALLIFKGGQVKLIERFPIETVTQCINLRNYLRKKKYLKYQCANVEAKIISGKITKIIKVSKVLKWFMTIIIYSQKF